MNTKGQSQILKADIRNRNENHLYRCLSTFNFGNYNDDSRKPFGLLEVFNDETLAPNHSTDFLINRKQSVFLIPLVGEISVTINGMENFIKPEETFFFSSNIDYTLEIKNISKQNLANYLQIRFENVSCAGESYLKNKFDFSNKNRMIPVFKNNNTSCFIGNYNGRSSENYTLKNKENGIFTFVIHGAFELQNRLLESGDGLSLKGFENIEFEALSENAILLFIEVSF